jgi:hypothetical protein
VRPRDRLVSTFGWLASSYLPFGLRSFLRHRLPRRCCATNRNTFIAFRDTQEDELISRERKKVMVVIGTRPEAIKLAPVVLELEKHRELFETKICVTGQHREMLDQMLQVFGLQPDYDLG